MECKLPESGGEAKAEACALQCDGAGKNEELPSADACCMKPKDDADACFVKPDPPPPKNSGDCQ